MKKIIFFIGLLIALACNKSNNNTPTTPPSGNLLSQRSYTVDTSSVVSYTNNQLVIDKSRTQLRPNAGDILLSAPSTNAPFGFLLKILGTVNSSSQIICSTEPSNLNDAFKQLTINFEHLDTFSSNAYLRTGASLSINFQNNNQIAPGIRLNGTLKFNIPSVKFEFSKKDGETTPEKILLQVELNTEGSTFELTNTNTSQVQVGSEIIWKEFNLPPLVINVPIVTPVGVIPIPMKFAQKLIVKSLPLSISGKAKWTILPEISSTIGIKYENGNWTNLSTYSINSSSMPLSSGDFSPSLSTTANVVIFKPVYEIAPYAIDALKGFFEVPSTIDFTAQTAIPNYSLKYKLDVTGGVKTKFWNGIEQNYSLTGNVITKNLLEGNFLRYILTDGSGKWKIPTTISPGCEYYNLQFNSPGTGIIDGPYPCTAACTRPFVWSMPTDSTIDITISFCPPNQTLTHLPFRFTIASFSRDTIVGTQSPGGVGALCCTWRKVP